MHDSSHPGVLLREWFEGAQASVTTLAAHIGVTCGTISRFINGHARVTAQMDLCLHQTLGTRQGLWSDMQKQRDLWMAKRTKKAPHP